MSTGKPISPREEWLEFWERREAPFLRALPYVLLILCVGFDIVTRHGVGSGMRAGLALAAAASLVMAAIDRLDRGGRGLQPRTADPAQRPLT
jgi:hypothetical protein